MNFRTDLALERHEILNKSDLSGVLTETEEEENIRISRMTIKSREAEKKLLKPKGRYITLEIPSFLNDAEIFDNKLNLLSKEISSVLPSENGEVLVVGLGNEQITADALGPKTSSLILATRHISSEIASSLGFDKLRSVASLAPGVLGRTGIETGEIIRGITDRIKPQAVIVVDALASRSIKRLGTTVQISDTGICPGSGVGNNRKRLDETTLGVKVISIGVPTVVDGETLVYDLTDRKKTKSFSALPESKNVVVTPKEIDLLIDRASKLISMAINCALQKDMTPEDIISLVS